MIDRRVLFFGDSLVAGVGDPEGRGWVGRIVASSFEAEMPLTAYNLEVRRQTSVEIAARFQAEVTPRLTPGADCGVVFSFGANDTTIEAGRLRVEPERSLESLCAAIDLAGGLDLRTLVVGPAPVDDGGQTDRIEALSRASSEICEERSVPFVDVVCELRDSEVWRQELTAGDGAHPGAPGYGLLADLVLTAGWHDWLRAR
jgi:lysophospholipase L1-like esterase